MGKQKAQVLKGSLQYILNQGTHEEMKIDISYIPDKTYLQVNDLIQIIGKLREEKPSLSGNDLCQEIFFRLRRLLMTNDINVKMRGKIDSNVTITTLVESKRKAGKAQSNDDGDEEDGAEHHNKKRKRHGGHVKREETDDRVTEVNDDPEVDD